MKKAIIILLTALVALSVFVSCNQDSILDEEFNKYVTVTFDSNNGSGATATQTIMKKTPTALDANGFKYAEHAFVCWNTKADGAGDTYTDTQEVKLEESITLYAQWSEVYTITEETTIFVPGKAYTTSGETTTIAERVMISAADIIEEGGSTSRDAIIKEERKPVIIFLERGTTLIAEKGIEVAEGQELNIQGSGTLIATAGVGSAGIGGGPGVNAGTIVISGGTITTTGGTFAAGIGGGKEGNGGVVTIIDGDVTATGGLSGGAGIGGGNKGNGGNVSILGGTVNAFGGEPSVSIPRGIGIGAGHGGKSAGTLEIGEGLGLYGGKDEESAEFLSSPTESYIGTRCEFMGTKATQYATITFAANGGKGEMEAQIVPYNIPRKLNANEFIHESLFFDGWATSDTGEVEYKNQAQIEIDGDITLYAHWIDVIMIDDTYGGTDGKKLEGGKRYSIEKDLTIGKRLYIDGTDEVTLTLPQGNTLTLSSGLNVASGQSLTIEGEGSLDAKATGTGDAGIGGSSGESAGTITINGGKITAIGGSGGGIGIGAGYGSTEHGVLKINKGLGLFGGADKDNVAFLSAPVDSYAGDRTVYMESKATSYVTVTFKPNGGEQTKDKTQTIPKGFGVPLAENTFTHKTLTFAGWITDTAKEEADYSDKQVVTLEKNLTLYALWIDVIILDDTYGGTEGNKLEGGKSYTIESDLIIEKRLYIDGTNNVTLILPKNSTLTLSSGLSVVAGQTLTIEGEGSLVAQGGANEAGIGGGANCDGGAVTINGGTVTATGGMNAAGIGGGAVGAGGKVTITGGTVTATCGNGGVAGIGRGYEGDSNGTLKIGDGQGLYGGADKDNVAFLSAPVDSYAGDRPVYMKSEATEYVTVTFDANDAKAEGTMNPQTVPKDFDIALNANAFTKTDWYFAGWNTASDGSGDSYSDKSLIKIDSSTTLYAQWTDGIPLDESYGGEGKKLEGGQKYTIVDDLTLAGRLEISDLNAVTIVLRKGYALTLDEGISVIAGQRLVIEGEGSLIAKGSADSAAIGGTNANAGGTVIIDGGIITATGGSRAAGIGGGYGAKCGTVTINGGTVTAIGGSNSAGIGGGEGGAGGEVTISGGTVTATGKDGALGIGKGKGGSSDGTLKIGAGMGLYGGISKDNAYFISAPVDSYDGTRYAYMAAKATTSYVKVTFNANGGSGTMDEQSVPSGENAYLSDNKFTGDTFVGWALTSDGDVAYSNQGIINIKANTSLYAKWITDVVTLTGSETALEGGKNYTISDNLTFSDRLSLDTTSSTEPVTLILPKDKTLTLNKGITVASGQTLIIMGEGNLIAKGPQEYSGIGSIPGSDKEKFNSGTVKIYGGNIVATGGVGTDMWKTHSGAGIGGGYYGGNGSVYIYGGKVTATAGNNAAGIGGGCFGDGGRIEISGGEVTTSGGNAGIGSGKNRNGATVIIAGGIVKASGNGSQGIEGSLKIGEGLCLFGGGVFLSGPVNSYSGSRPSSMETKVAEVVTISFDANGGTGTMSNQSAASGYAAKLKANEFTNGDLYFGGWALTKTGNIEYENNESITVNGNTTLYAKWVDAIPITTKTSTLEGGKKYTIESSLTNNHRLSISGTEAAIIDLPAGKTLTLPNGINVPADRSLIIRGEGSLEATGGSYNAGIGGGNDQVGGTITIESGNVKATGGISAAGIGGGGSYSGNVGKDGGTITILGGTVIAKGGNGGAGIGGGNGTKGGGNGGEVTISGGSVEATGGSGGAGIGGGEGYSAETGAYGGNGGKVTISGGSVEATGVAGGAGIGGGSIGGAGGEIITISGGTVKAEGRKSSNSSSDGGAAGIGGGSGGVAGQNKVPGGDGGTVNISGGDVTAIGYNKAAGIGGGGGFSEDRKGGAGGTVTITGGTVKATGGSASIGIGKGEGYGTAQSGVLKVGDIENPVLGLYGGTNEANASFLSKPTNSYPDTNRPVFMEVKATDYVTITYNGNDGEGEMSSDLMVKDFAFYNLTANEFTTPTEGLIFIGWATSASGPVVYSDEGSIAFSEDVTLYAQWGTDVVITDSLKKLVAGHNHINIGDVTNNNRLYITGGDSATITLTEGKTVTLTKGINVPVGKALTIDGEGTLIATGASNDAGIGGNRTEAAGTITIKGGTVTATGHNDEHFGSGAGIGGGGRNGFSEAGAGGTVYINGGKVTATGGQNAAGIGGGGGGSTTSGGFGGVVTITGGTITANGGLYAAGIGGGSDRGGGTVTIYGGTITANGGGNGAGIGGGTSGAGANVTITGGTVTATGGSTGSYSGMGIGTGANTGGGSTDQGELAYVTMQVSDNGTAWNDYDGTKRYRYMKTN